MQAGKIFFLLGGLDEVREEDTSRVIDKIWDVADRFPRNQFVITCQIAAKDYTFQSFAASRLPILMMSRFGRLLKSGLVGKGMQTEPSCLLRS